MLETRQQARTETQIAAIRSQLERVLEGTTFRSSPRQQRLLRHLVEATLAGDAHRLKGYTLGVEVFDRGADFDPNVDPIVRVEVGRLRGKLLAHYAGEGAEDAVWLDVPKGGYAVRFEFGHSVRTQAHRVQRDRMDARSDAIAFGRPAANVPAAVDRLIGRDGDVATLGCLLAEHRLVTVLGAGGIGKTRLAQAVAQAHADATTEGAAWVDLARIADPALLPATLALALGLPIVQSGDPLPGLLAALRPLTTLMVLDNAEHLVDAVARLVRAVIDAAAGIRVLVTSQSALHIEGERVFRLAALEAPPPDAPLAEAARAGAVALFVDRARAVDHRFELTEANIGSVARLCRRLDGLPLAIRLAAARLPLLGLSGLEARLHQRLQLLTADSRDAPTRQQTLLAALDWSYGLLPVPEQALFRQLGAFVGGFTLDLAVASGREAGLDEWAVVERLQTLVERSLVHLEAGDPPRYRLLESQREYALRQLDADTGEPHAAQRRHAQAMARVLWDGAHAVWWSSDADWLAQWAPELDNMRAALDWSQTHDVALFVSLVGSASALFRLLDVGYELSRRAAAIDIEAVGDIDPVALARYWLARAFVESGAGPKHDFALAAERLARTISDRRRLYLALCQRAASALVPRDEDDALLGEIAALESDDWPPRLRTQRCVAEFTVHNVNARRLEELQAAQAGYALALQAGSVSHAAIFATWIVVALLDLGDIHGASKRSLELRDRALSAPTSLAIPFVGTCARCSLLKGELADAKRQFARMFEMCRTVEWIGFEFFADFYMQLALAEGRVDDAARLLGFATVASMRSWRVPRNTLLRDEVGAVLASASDAARLAQLRADGEGLDFESVCTLVLNEPRPS